MHAQVAVGRRHELLQVVEAQGFIDGQRAENSQAQAFVNETIERQRPLDGAFPPHRAEGAATFCSRRRRAVALRLSLCLRAIQSPNTMWSPPNAAIIIHVPRRRRDQRDGAGAHERRAHQRHDAHEYVPALTTAAPYSSIQTPGRNANMPRSTNTAVSTARRSSAAEAQDEFLIGPEMSGTFAVCDLIAMEATGDAVRDARFGDPDGDPSPGEVMRRHERAATAVTPMATCPQPETAGEGRRAFQDRGWKRRLSMARACISRAGQTAGFEGSHGSHDW